MKILRAALLAAMAVTAVMLVIDLLHFANGSLEMYPAQDDHDQERLATGVVALFLGMVEAVLWLLFLRLGRTAPRAGAPSVARAGAGDSRFGDVDFRNAAPT